MKTLAVRVKPELHRDTRIRAIEEGRSLGELVADALELYLSKNGARDGTPGAKAGRRSA